ncbi:DUF3152 domain-containing protein [Actinoplanes sp. LDG1-06]|uniref:DUF3152 domain-containing protein n=1 Tax=Paractinoplanes ovalisporus TaxID=2810368 RepID=A0ABS2A469_9ACTN|nr:DUF3152 domain-containing protein [Actinoplanes ovalisporus]MBM2614063.1 DUF3152 domain-containing protein [Actinoplanes ovalisporus]
MTMRMSRWAAALLAAGLVTGCSTAASPSPPPPEDPPVTQATAPRTTTRPARAPVKITYPREGTGRWIVAPAASETAGTGGRLMRYRVVVEGGIKGVSPAGFAAAAGATLEDPRGWTGGGQWRFRRVGPGQRYDFTLYLATPATRGKLCGDASDDYTSCRNGAKVVLNVARWVGGVPGYKGDLKIYRQYMVNHEVGHRLGNGHELCPGKGELAPVMLQQTLGLHGCKKNAWPYPDGDLYRGPSGHY